MQNEGELADRMAGLMDGRTSEVLLQRVIVEDGFGHAESRDGGGGEVVSVSRENEWKG